MKRRLIPALVLAFLLTLLPFGVQAADSMPQTTPLQTGLSAAPAQHQVRIAESSDRDVLWAGNALTMDQAAAQLRKQMVARQEICEVYVKAVDYDYVMTLNTLMERVADHTGNPKEGDYLAWQVAGTYTTIYEEPDSEGQAYRFVIEVEYFTTAAQEAELDTAVKNLLSSLGVNSMSDYQKVKAVYDYMINNITYDEAHLGDETYTLQFTAYAALMNKTAVCQGYANLLYRLLLEMGIDCRVIAGETDGGGHAWNICKLGNVYYNLDATWDAGYDDYAYFLRNSEGFADHYRYLEYMTTQFHTQYPMSATDYVDGVAGQPEHIYVYGMCGEDAYFAVDRDGVLTIFGTGEIADFTEPDSQSDDASPAPWVYWQDGFDTVIVEDGITTIGQNAFSCLNNIKYITLSDSVTTIDYDACIACEGLVSIDLGNGVESIGSSAFSLCSSLSSIDLPESLYSLGAHAFRGCSSLTEITIPKSVSEISYYAFSDCTNLKTVNLVSGSLMLIDERAFDNCDSLTAITIPNSVTRIASWAFAQCDNLATIHLSVGLETIEVGAFGTCSSLTEVTIPSTVTSLSGFSGCANLETVNFENQYVDNYAFDSCPKLKNLNFSEGFLKIGDAAFQYCNSLTEVIIPPSVTYLGSNAFQYCESLKRVILNNTSVDSYTFNGCTALETVEFGPDIELIYICAFDGCSGLKELWFSGNAPDISNDAFRGVTATAYYPANNTTWTADKLQDYGGSLTWVSGHVHDFTGVEPVYDPATRTHIWDCLTCDVNVTENCSFDNGKVTEDASITEPGVMTYTCSVCGGTYEEEFPLRLYGSNRYKTAFVVADTLKDELGVEQFDNIIIANGQAFADALAGSYLAVQKNAPILLVNQHTMESVSNFIAENLAVGGTVYLLGGEAAIPAQMEEFLDGLTVKRLAGANRYETNLLILEEAGIGDDEILICTGNGFADSLSASAVGKPILLVNKSLNDNQKAFLENTSGEFVIIGGESAVSAALETGLKEFGTVERLAGANRYETSVLVAEKFFKAPSSAVLAYAQNFPDGLCGGPLAAATNSPLLLIATGRGPGVVEYANEAGITCGAVLGGPTLIDDTTANKVFSLN